MFEGSCRSGEGGGHMQVVRCAVLPRLVVHHHSKACHGPACMPCSRTRGARANRDRPCPGGQAGRAAHELAVRVRSLLHTATRRAGQQGHPAHLARPGAQQCWRSRLMRLSRSTLLGVSTLWGSGIWVVGDTSLHRGGVRWGGGEVEWVGRNVARRVLVCCSVMPVGPRPCGTALTAAPSVAMPPGRSPPPARPPPPDKCFSR